MNIQDRSDSYNIIIFYNVRFLLKTIVNAQTLCRNMFLKRRFDFFIISIRKPRRLSSEGK